MNLNVTQVNSVMFFFVMYNSFVLLKKKEELLWICNKPNGPNILDFCPLM